MENLQGQKAVGPKKAKRVGFGCWNMRTLVESDGTIATAHIHWKGSIIKVHVQCNRKIKAE